MGPRNFIRLLSALGSARNQYLKQQQSQKLANPQPNRYPPRPKSATPVYDQLAPQYQALVAKTVPTNAKEDAAKVLHENWWAGQKDPETLAYALATTNKETGGTFKPVREGYWADPPNSPGRTGRKEALKRGYDGGADYYGRGYIQLTHKKNYRDYGKQVGADLENNPDKALEQDIAAKVSALYFKNNPGISQAVRANRLKQARKLINGGTYGLNDVNQAYRRYLNIIRAEEGG